MSNSADRTIWTGDNLDILCGLNAAPVGSAAAGAAFAAIDTRFDSHNVAYVNPFVREDRRPA